MKDVFSSLKIVELASVLAGPAVGTFFSELGAEVIKIENKPTGGDITRRWKLPSEGKDQLSAYYSSVNYKKSIVFKDLKNEVDREDVYSMIKDCDIVISNFKKSSATKLGMDYEQLTKVNPKIIFGQINGFESNPKRVAYDAVLQAETGYMSMTGEPGRPPVKMPLAMIDILAAHQLKEGLLVALWQRAKSTSDKPVYVECSLEKTALASLANQAGNYLMAGHIAQPMGSTHPNIAPYGEIFISKDDRAFILAVGTDKQFRLIEEFLKLDPKEIFVTNESRVKNRKALSEHLAPALFLHLLDVVMSFCIDHNIPIGEIKTMDRVLDTELAKSMILEEVIEGSPTRRMKTVAFEMKVGAGFD